MSRQEVAIQQMVDQIALYRAKNLKSAELYERARSSLPGGNTRATLFTSPYPIYTDHGEGAYIFDVDGNKRLDLNQNFFSMVLGHANPAVAKAIADWLPRGNAFGTATETEINLAEMICRRAPNFERVRFANSGTEATMNAIRVAKAFTGKPKFAKIEGGYHGTHDAVHVSIEARSDELAGPAHAPRPVPESPGLLTSVAQDVIIISWNDAAAAERIVRENKDELAAVIAEPVMGGGGIIPPDPAFLQELRRITEENGVLLILDEVITFRLAPGGAQEYYGVRADLTTTGKIIGGGLPVGAFGGRADIMEVTDPSSPRFAVKHMGTFSANPLTMVAGAAVLEQLTPEVYQHLNTRGDGLRKDLAEVFKRHSVPAQVTGAGSLFAIHFTPREVHNVRDVATVDTRRKERFYWWMLNNGVFMSKGLYGGVTAPMNQSDIDMFLEQADAFAKTEAAAS